MSRRRKLSLDERRKVLETQPEVKWISIIDNNDEFAESRNHLIRMNQTKSMDNLLTDLTRSLRPHRGAVRNIYTPYGGTKVTGLEQLESRKLYVVGGGKFKANSGNRSKRASWSNGHHPSKLDSLDNSNRHSSESNSYRSQQNRRNKRPGISKALTPDDDYNEYFKTLYERNKRLVTRGRRPLYENKNAQTSRRRRDDASRKRDQTRSKSTDGFSTNSSPKASRDKRRSPSPRYSRDRNTPSPQYSRDRKTPPGSLNLRDRIPTPSPEYSKDKRSSPSPDYTRDRRASPSPTNSGYRRKSPSPPMSGRQHKDSAEIRSRRSRDSGTYSTRKNSQASVRSFHERGTFVNNSERNSADRRSETRVQSSHRVSDDERDVKYSQKFSDAQSHRGSADRRDRKQSPGSPQSHYERVLSGLSRLSTTGEYAESKDQGGKT